MNGAKAISILGTLALSFACVACSDDSYIATNNENVLDSGSSGGEAGEGSGGQTSGGSGGDSGSAGTGGAAGGGGECTPGEEQVLGTCEKCGTSTQTCDENGAFGAPVCTGQGACTPGETTTSGCSDPCADKKCGNDCSWGTCGLKSGATCLHEGGSNFQCCGTDQWQFCNSSTCNWYSCQACAAGSSCLNAC